MKKAFIYILLTLHVFFAGNFGVITNTYLPHANALSNAWDFSTPGDYTLSTSTGSEINGGLGSLKKRFEHIGFIIDNTDLNAVYDVVVDGDYAYLTSNANATDMVTVVDISDPTSPSIEATVLDGVGGAGLNGASSIEKIGNYLYVASQISDLIQVIDVTTPTSPTVGAQITNSPTTRQLNGPRGLVVNGNYLYVAAQNGRAVITIDVTTPASPVYLDTDREATNLRATRDLIVKGDHVIATSNGRDRVTSLDITTATDPVADDSINDGTLLNGAWHISGSGNYAYVSANNNDSVEVVDVTDPSNMSTAATISGGSFLLDQPRGSEIIDDVLFVTANGSDAVNAIDISDPTAPVFLESITDTSGGDQELNGARGITSVGNRLFVAAGADDALEILDFDYDSTSPTIIPTTAFSFGTEELSSFTETLGADNAGTVTYQISRDDGTTWYYHNGTSWQTTTNGEVDSNSASAINTNIDDFNSVGAGSEFLWKAFLISDGTEKVEIDNIDITSTPVIPSLSITKVDNDADNSVQTDQIVRYTITLTNTGSDATGISITDSIDTDFGTPYNFTYASCGSPSESFVDPTLTFSSISVDEGDDCIITYDLQVDSGATGGSTITNSADASAAIEGGNNPAIVTADSLSVLACGVNDVSLVFETDAYGEDTYWSLTPNGNACGVGEIANGGNTTDLTCASGGAQSANAANGYADNATITEGPYSLTVGSQYDLHVVDDWGDDITAADPDVRIQQNGADTDTFAVTGTGGIFTFTVTEPTGCIDTTDPSVTVNQAPSQSDPTLVDSATFKVVFSEVINTGTFTSGDISLSGTTGTVTSGPTEVAPNNGTSFEFTVTGMTDTDVVTATMTGGIVEDLAGNTNIASTSTDNQITYTGGDITPPVISSTNFASGSLLPGGNHDIIIEYSDAGSGIDVASADIELYKWDGVSAFGADISGANIISNSVSTSTGSYSTNNLDFGKYRYSFSIDDNDGNTATVERDFYIDIPEFLVGTGAIDIGTVNHLTNTFSDTVTVTVRTVGAGFNVYMDTPTPSLSYDTENINAWDTTTGFGYDPAPYSTNISAIGTNQNIATQTGSINTNGDKNTYTYDIKLGTLIESQQAGGDYEGNIDFGIILDY